MPGQSMRVHGVKDAATDFGLLLEVECVDLLQLSLKPEEERCLVCLKRGLRVLQRFAITSSSSRCKYWGGAQLFDELFAVSSWSWAAFSSLLRHTFFKAL